MLTIDPTTIPVPQLHGYLLGAIGPRPIAFASTLDANGVPNLAPFSFFNVFSANPPILIFSPARSGRTNETKDTYKNVKVVPEVVINVVTYDIMQQVSLASCPYPIEVNEFEKSGLTPIASDLVKPFRVAESPVQFECKVIKIEELGNQGGAGNLIFCEVVRLHINEAILDEKGKIDNFKSNLVSRMGGDWYCHANRNSIFLMEKPITSIGIGFDNLPDFIRKSDIFTGNDLGKLANVESVPNETEVNEYKLTELNELFVSLEQNPKQLRAELHLLAKKLLQENKTNEAWLTLLAYNN
jgi:flavin reductase (DIM6/NTAB) family NADH-FMN oxidoreductase RutF